jgi:SPP1 gp7 family putative phage head morphogenesis protein
VTVKPTPQGLEYKQRVDGVDVPLDAKYLTHFRRFNPYNPYRGLSELASLMLELNVDWNAATWNQSFFGDQNGIPTGLLKPVVGAIVPSADREEYLKQWNTRHSRKRGVGILPPGWDWVAAGGSPKDMEFADMREFSREQILAVYGVPPFMAGVLDKANYANAREQRALYWNGTITRLLSYFQGVINHDFLPKVGVAGIEVWPDFESVKALTEDLETKSRIAQAFFAMGFTKRMLNDRLDLGMDVDELEDADVGYLPLSVLPVEMVEEAHTPAGPALPPGDDDQAQGPKPTKGFLRAVPRAMAGRRANVWRSISTRTRDLEARFEKAIRKHFRAIEDEVLAQLNSLKGWNLVHGVEKADSSYLFDLEYSKGALVKLVAPLYAEAVKRGGTSVMSELSTEIEMDMLNPGVTSKLAELTHKIKRIDDTVERQLRESLVEGLRGGESISQLQTRIQDVMSASRSRAATIARTETGTAFNSGRVEGMRQAGVSKQEWLATKDSVTRDTHEALDGEVRAIDEAFSNGLRYPGDPSGLPEEIINCRCTVLPVIGEANV